MQIWSYLVVTHPASTGWHAAGDSSLRFAAGDALDAVLSQAGERGWELVAGAGTHGPGAQYIFKRPVDIGEDAEAE